MNTLLLAAAAVSMGGLINFLVWLLVAALVIWVVFLVLGMLPLPPQVRTIISVILAIVFLHFILSRLGLVV